MWTLLGTKPVLSSGALALLHLSGCEKEARTLEDNTGIFVSRFCWCVAQAFKSWQIFNTTALSRIRGVSAGARRFIREYLQ